MKNVEHVSTFFITINTNQTEESLLPRLKDVYSRIYSNLLEFIKWKGRNGEEPDKIDKIDGEAHCEIGPKYGFVHLHAMVSVRHRTMIQLDAQKIGRCVRDHLELGGVHCHVQFVKDPSMSILAYMRKNIPDT